METLKRFLKDERGLETVEYAIILGLIVAGTITTIVLIGDWVYDKFSDTEVTLSTASPI